MPDKLVVHGEEECRLFTVVGVVSPPPMKLLFHEVLFVHVDLDGLAGRQFPIPDLIHTTLVLGERELPPVAKVLLQDVVGDVGVNKVLKAYRTKSGLQIRHFEKNSRAKKLITQGKNSITQQKNSRI